MNIHTSCITCATPVSCNQFIAASNTVIGIGERDYCPICGLAVLGLLRPPDMDLIALRHSYCSQHNVTAQVLWTALIRTRLDVWTPREPGEEAPYMVTVRTGNWIQIAVPHVVGFLLLDGQLTFEDIRVFPPTTVPSPVIPNPMSAGQLPCRCNCCG